MIRVEEQVPLGVAAQVPRNAFASVHADQAGGGRIDVCLVDAVCRRLRRDVFEQRPHVDEACLCIAGIRSGNVDESGAEVVVIGLDTGDVVI